MAQLNRFTSEEWDAWARKSNWNSRLLAKLTGIPARTLNRYTHDTFGQSPQHWLDLNRLGLAPALLKQIRCVKTVAYELAYPSHASFTRRFKKKYGSPPMTFIECGTLGRGGQELALWDKPAVLNSSRKDS